MFSHVMVGVSDLEVSKKFYDALLGTLGIAPGVANGGTTCEDPPGWREGAVGKLYLAYLRDPDGNKICALHRPAK
jgi:catechol 2,3-dioxygenase-like lactoylglutathione lyase family enzyme